MGTFTINMAMFKFAKCQSFPEARCLFGSDQDGNYLGRTTELPSLLPRLGGITVKSQSQLTLLDTGDAVVMAARPPIDGGDEVFFVLKSSSNREIG